MFDSLILHSPLVGERQMLFERLDRLGSQDMLVLDRGYPGRWLVAVLLQRGIPFCMRCDSSSTFTAITQFMRSGQDEAVAILPSPNRQDAADYECARQPSTVRLIRQVTPEGKVRPPNNCKPSNVQPRQWQVSPPAPSGKPTIWAHLISVARMPARSVPF